jgi:tetratricopeptide (TPR) repeat protein
MGTGIFQIYYESPAFKEFHNAVCVTRNFEHQARIVEQQVSNTSGTEKVFWLILRLERRQDTCRSPRDVRLLWSDLAEILAAGPHEPGVIECVINKAVQLYWISEHSDQLAAMLPVFRPFRGRGLMNMLVRQNLGELAIRKRRWYSAYRHYSLALDTFQASSGSERKLLEGVAQHQYAQRAQAAAIMGRMQPAQADIAAAQALAASKPPGVRRNYPLALAEATMAYLERRYQDARSILQYADATTPAHGRPVYADVDFLLMAARIARAEGNMPSFHHFCQQAQAICTEHEMPLTGAAVQAVISGADF